MFPLVEKETKRVHFGIFDGTFWNLPISLQMGAGVTGKLPFSMITNYDIFGAKRPLRIFVAFSSYL